MADLHEQKVSGHPTDYKDIPEQDLQLQKSKSNDRPPKGSSFVSKLKQKTQISGHSSRLREQPDLERDDFLSQDPNTADGSSTKGVLSQKTESSQHQSLSQIQQKSQALHLSNQVQSLMPKITAPNHDKIPKGSVYTKAQIPPAVYQRGKSATQSIVNLAQSEKVVLDQQSHISSFKSGIVTKANLVNAAKNLPPIQSSQNDSQLLINEDAGGDDSDKGEEKVDYEARNLEKLKALQEARQRELKMIEDERNRMLRRQEKLKNSILKQAAEYKEQKAQREQLRLQMIAQNEQENQRLSPKKKKKKEEPTEGRAPEEVVVSDEEKKQKEVMKKYYRNRYSSFIQALALKKAEEEKAIEAAKEKDEKRKAKLKEKVLGQQQIVSKVYQDKAEQSQSSQDDDEPTMIGNNAILAHSQAVFSTQSQSLRKKMSRRGSSVSLISTSQQLTNSEFQVAHAYNVKLGKQKHGKPTSSQKCQRSDKQRKLGGGNMQERNRTLTPKITRSKQQIMPVNEVPLEVHDEVKEQELLQQAAERKARAEQIRARQEKLMKQLKDEKEAKMKQKTDAEEREKKLKDLARMKVLEQFEQIKNQPGLKEQQQEKETKLKPVKEKDEDTPKKEKVKVVHNTQAFEQFIERNIPQNKVFLNITDMATWKKKNRVDESTKVFIIRGGYGDIKKALKDRGWIENKDKDSCCFDLKWTLKTKDIDTNALLDYQIVNHFAKATSITTKVGLTHSLKNLIWFNNIDVDTFYPRCFDLGLPEETDDFITDFKATKAQCYLKIFVRELREAFDNGQPLVSATVGKDLLKVAQSVTSRRVRDLDDLIDDPTAFGQLVSDAEWKILSADELTEQSLAQKKHVDWMKKNDAKMAEKKKKKKKRVKKQLKIKEEQEEYGIEDDQAEEEDDDKEKDDDEQIVKDRKIAAKSTDFKITLDLIEQLKTKFPQFGIDGERNIWIVKPAGSSRGRGICLFKNLVEIIDLTKQIETQYIVQKYIESSLIVKARKFDLRQWVLVTDWNPLTVWMYAEPYIRFPASDFNLETLTNRYSHLSNNSVAKNAKNVTTQYYIDGNMWCLQEFQDYLQEEYGYDVWETDLVEKIKNVVINSLESVQDMFELKRGQQHELFGYDIMVDDEFNCWLIEVNSSPAMDYSTPVTERLVKMVLEDTVKVVVDYALAPTQKKKSKVETGLFECIYRATRVVDKPMASFGLNMEVVGKKVKAENLGLY